MRALTLAVLTAFFSSTHPLGSFPEGSVLLKEKLDADTGKTLLFTGMVKREKGYFPDCGDWEFFTVDAAGTKIAARGMIQKCASCHQNYDRGDFVTRESVMGTVQTSRGRIVLHAATAELHPAVNPAEELRNDPESGRKQVRQTTLRYEEQAEKNTLGYWTDAHDWASWSFDVKQTGTFAIHLWQGCGPGSGGSEVEIRCAGQTVRLKVEETGGFQNFRERVAGEVSFFLPGRQTLEVRAVSKPGMAVMDLRQILLEPVQKQDGK